MRHHFNHALLYQFLRFAAVGLSGTLVQYLTLWTGHGYLALLSAQSASAIGYILGSLVNYALNYFFTFSSSKSHKEAASKYFSILAVGWCINYALMGYLVTQLNWYYWFAQFLSTGFVLLWNFSGSKWWAFKHKPT
jgi:putative flippase GtrA